MRRVEELIVAAVVLDESGLTREAVVRRLVEALAAAGRLEGVDLDDVCARVAARERLGSTGIGMGVALPHARVAELERPAAACAVVSAGVEFDSLDGEPVRLVILLLGPPLPPGQHLGRAVPPVIESLHRALGRESVRRRLMAARTSAEVFDEFCTVDASEWDGAAWN